jgi:hypothetical protein
MTARRTHDGKSWTEARQGSTSNGSTSKGSRRLWVDRRYLCHGRAVKSDPMSFFSTAAGWGKRRQRRPSADDDDAKQDDYFAMVQQSEKLPTCTWVGRLSYVVIRNISQSKIELHSNNFHCDILVIRHSIGASE